MRPLRLRALPWEIVDNRDEGASIRTLRVLPLGHDGFVFAPGQFAWLITGASPWSSQQHPLSISSSAFRTPSGEIEFSVKSLGDWSSQTVPDLRAGTRVWVDGPFGAFTIDRATAAPGIVLIAGGIGIAPLRSMLLTMRDRHDPRPVVLVYAAHDETRLAFTSELAALHTGLNLTIVYALEEPRGILESETGLVSVDLLPRRLPPWFRDYVFYICGPAPMMDGVEAHFSAAAVRATWPPISLVRCGSAATRHGRWARSCRTTPAFPRMRSGRSSTTSRAPARLPAGEHPSGSSETSRAALVRPTP